MSSFFSVCDVCFFNQNMASGVRISDWSSTCALPIFLRALQAPVRQIAENAGFDCGVVAGKLFDQKDTSFGFNASTDVYEDLVKAGVIDPTKFVRIALQDAASVAGLLITTEAGIAESPDYKNGRASCRERVGKDV